MTSAKILQRTANVEVAKTNAADIQISNQVGSDISLKLKPDDVADIRRVGDDLIIELANGDVITINDFYAANAEQSPNRLFLSENNEIVGVDTANLDGLNLIGAGPGVEALTFGGSAIFPIEAALTALALGGGVAAAVALTDGGGSDDDEAVTLDEPTITEAEINDDDTITVSGTGEPGTTAHVTFPDGTDVSVEVDDDGTFGPVTSAEPQPEGDVSVQLSDEDGNLSDIVVATPADDAPDAPTLAIADDGASVSGTGVPGATVLITDETGAEVATAIVDEDGNFSVPLDPPLTNGEELAATQTTDSGNASPAAIVSAPDATPPAAPTLSISDNGAAVSGTGEPGATVSVTDENGDEVASAIVGDDGTFSADLPEALTNGEELTATQTDDAGNVSPGATDTAPDSAAPAAPAAPTLDIADDGASVSGTGEPGATVSITDEDGDEVATATVGAGGGFTADLSPALTNGEVLTATQTDDEGNTSPAATDTAPDTTAPAAPTLDIADDGASVSGTGEPGATVSITDEDGDEVATATVGAGGGFTADLSSALTGGEELTATQTDDAGNVSPGATDTAPVIDTDAPDAPTLDIADDGASVSGTGEPGATVSITDEDGDEVATATVGGGGNFSADLSPALTDGEVLTATQTDDAGNTSPPATDTAPDTGTTLDVTASNGSEISGTGEAGATIDVDVDGDGTADATSIVDDNGNFSVDISSVLPQPQAFFSAGNSVGEDESNELFDDFIEITVPSDIDPSLLVVSFYGENGELVSPSNLLDAVGGGDVQEITAQELIDLAGGIGGTLENPNNGSGPVTDDSGRPLTVRLNESEDGSIVITIPATGGTTETAQGLTAWQTATITQLADVDASPGDPGNEIIDVLAHDIQGTGTGADQAAIPTEGFGAGATSPDRTLLGDAVGTFVERDSLGNLTVLNDIDLQDSNGINNGVFANQPVVVTATDSAGNTVTVTEVIEDLVSPFSVALSESDGTPIVGTGEAGATVDVDVTGDGESDFSTTVGGGGGFSIPGTGISDGDTVTITQSDDAGNTSTPIAAAFDVNADVVSDLEDGNETLTGGSGDDDVVLLGFGEQITLDFTDLDSDAITEFERIDITGNADNSVIVTQEDVLDISSTSDELIILGDAGDSVTATGFADTGADRLVDGSNFNVLTAGAATLLVEEDVTIA